MAFPNEGGRLVYFISSLIAASMAVLGNWVFLGFWIYEAVTAPQDKYRIIDSSYSSSYLYIVAKLIIMGAYFLVWIWVTMELIIPIGQWWWALAKLKDFIPYVRPTEEEVRAADTFTGRPIDDDNIITF